MTALIQVRDLCRHFAGRAVVQGIDFELQRGEVVGFLGPNGAGKSTTMRMLCGALAADSGRILIDGIDLRQRPVAAKRQLGYLPETPPLYPELSVDEYLGFCARLRGLSARQGRRALARSKARCGLEAVGRRLIGNLSKGYRQRVGIAQAIIHDPAVIVLDEPTSGLDPNQIREIRQLIRQLGEERSVLLSTHILPEVQALCDRLLILHQGRLVHRAELGRPQQGQSLIVELGRPPGLETLQGLPGIRRAEAHAGNRFQLWLEAGQDSGRLAERLVGNGWSLQALIPVGDDLEQVFTRLTSGEPA